VWGGGGSGEPTYICTNLPIGAAGRTADLFNFQCNVYGVENHEYNIVSINSIRHSKTCTVICITPGYNGHGVSGVESRVIIERWYVSIHAGIRTQHVWYM
jgi:hypothetical protein